MQFDAVLLLAASIVGMMIGAILGMIMLIPVKEVSMFDRRAPYRPAMTAYWRERGLLPLLIAVRFLYSGSIVLALGAMIWVILSGADR